MFDDDTDYSDDPVDRLKLSLASGIPVDSDLISQLKQCVRNADWDACPWLAICYALGWGVKSDRFVCDLLLCLAEAKGSSQIDAVQEYTASIANTVNDAVNSHASDRSSSSKTTGRGRPLYEFVTNCTVIDLETTGFSPCSDDITELAAIRVRDGLEVERFQELVRPNKKIPDCVVRKTHISNEMLSSARTIKEVLPAFLDFIADDVLVGYNIERFDIPFICRNAERELGRLINNDFVDVYPLTKDLIPGLCSYKLDQIRCHLDIDCVGSHRALKDCEDTLAIYLKLKDKSSELIKETVGSNFDGFDVPANYAPVKKPDIPTAYKERWEYVKSHPFVTLASSNIVFTGDGPNMPRTIAEETASILGAEVRPRVTRDCDFCVILESPGLTKVEAANKWRDKGSSIKILTIDEFKSIVYDSIKENQA